MRPADTAMSLHTRTPSFLLAIVAVLIAAAPQHVLAAGLFERADRNSDGIVTPEELPDQRLFKRFDLNQDGAITLEEYQRTILSKEGGDVLLKEVAAGGADALLDRVFTYFDANHDGIITRKEAGKAGWFDKLDLDHDKQVTAPEVQKLRTSLAQKGAQKLFAESSFTATSPATPAPVTSGPIVQNPAEVAVGRQVADLTIQPLRGEPITLSAPSPFIGTVIAFTSTTCPVSKRYIPRFAALQNHMEKRNIRMIVVDPFAKDEVEDMLRLMNENSIRAPWIHDRDKALSATLQTRTTTEFFLLDATRTVIYRGALDDQFGADYSLDAPRHTYLLDAVESLVAGRLPTIAATTPPGCEIELPQPKEAKVSAEHSVTYHRDIARILRQHCVRCHHDGGIAPFALDDRESVMERAKVIQRVLFEGTMPPWFAAHTSSPSPWRNDATLPARDRADLLAWLASSDKPEGNLADAPPPLSFPTTWQLGEPDHVISTSRSFEVKATGFMPYQFDTVETALAEDRWVSAYEILPEQRAVVHHVLVRVHPPGKKSREAGDGTGYWAAYVPGNSGTRYPDGFARKLPAGSRINFQIHYTPNGTPTTDRIRIGLHFAKTPPLQEVKTLPIANTKLQIPPGAEEHREEFTRPAPFDVPIMGLMPHMHVRGRSFRYEIVRNGSEPEALLDIPRYDFNWQLRYDFKEPKILRAGEQLRIIATFDNSPNNRANPDPSRTVKWGEQTSDEMMIGYVEYHSPVTH